MDARRAPPSAPNPPTSPASDATTTTPALSPQIEQYVSADPLNVWGSTKWKGHIQTTAVQKVRVYEKANDWVRISMDGQPAKWLSSKSLCGGPNCYVTPSRIHSVPLPTYVSTCDRIQFVPSMLFWERLHLPPGVDTAYIIWKQALRRVKIIHIQYLMSEVWMAPGEV